MSEEVKLLPCPVDNFYDHVRKERMGMSIATCPLRTPSLLEGEKMRKIWDRLETELHTEDGLEWTTIEAISIDLGRIINAKPTAFATEDSESRTIRQRDEAECMLQKIDEVLGGTGEWSNKYNCGIQALNRATDLQAKLAEKQKLYSNLSTEWANLVRGREAGSNEN